MTQKENSPDQIIDQFASDPVGLTVRGVSLKIASRRSVTGRADATYPDP
ncbi:hypothetical protein [Rhizobium tropici]|nr:hypothetical protein [Rhizobium tropici]